MDIYIYIVFEYNNSRCMHGLIVRPTYVSLALLYTGTAKYSSRIKVIISGTYIMCLLH